MGFNSEMNIVDKLVLLKEHKEKALKIIDYLDNKISFTNKQVSIFGQSGTGKSEICYYIKEFYCDRGKCTKILHLDDYYTSDPHNRARIRLETQTIGIDEIDWGKLSRHTQGHFNSRYHLILIDGLFAANAIGNSFNIMIEGNLSDTEAFRKLRGKENPDCTFRQHVLKCERADVESLRDKADYNV